MEFMKNVAIFCIAVIVLFVAASLIQSCYDNMDFNLKDVWKETVDEVIDKHFGEKNRGFEYLVSNAHIEYQNAETEQERNSIIRYTKSIYPEGKPDMIKDETVRNFYIMCTMH